MHWQCAMHFHSCNRAVKNNTKLAKKAKKAKNPLSVVTITKQSGLGLYRSSTFGRLFHFPCNILHPHPVLFAWLCRRYSKKKPIASLQIPTQKRHSLPGISARTISDGQKGVGRRRRALLRVSVAGDFFPLEDRQFRGTSFQTDCV